LKDHDDVWVNSRDFITVCHHAGLQGDTPEMIRAMYLDGTLNFRALETWNNGRTQ
jgi:hypothetical protein